MARNPKSPAPLKFGVGDIETDPFKKGRTDIEAFCAGLSYEGFTQTFWGKDCLPQLVAAMREAADKRGVKVFYFHNGGNFDFHFLLAHLPVNECKFLCIGKRIVQLKTPWGFELRDSFAIIPKKLASYQKTKISYRLFEREVRHRHQKKILAYLVDDLKDLHKMVSGFMARFPAELTLASATSKILAKDFGAEIGRSTADYDARLRPFYFAGRVQFWQLGQIKGRMQTVDINSAFPWAMTLAHWHGSGSDSFDVLSKIPRTNAEQSFFAVECDSDGELPLRKDDGGVDFPKGRHTFFVTGWELLAAMELKKVRNLEIKVCYRPKKTKDFAKFVNFFYAEKLAAKLRGDKESEFFAKIVLNGGYGRLALNPRRFSEVSVTTIYDTPDAEATITPEKIAELGWKWKKDVLVNAKGKPVTKSQLERESDGLGGWAVKWDDKERGLTFHSRASYREGFDKFVNVATAASITGCVRALLMRAKAKCKGVVYCDTDSLTAADISGLKLSDKLGDWKHEATFDRDSFWIAGKKLYAGYSSQKFKDDKKKGEKNPGWKTASKGVRLGPRAIVAVALGKMRQKTAIAPTYSVFSKPKFVSRKIRRADKRK